MGKGMIDSFRSVALVLLAAGRSSRFGTIKQRAMIDGEFLLRKTAQIYQPFPFLMRIAVVRDYCPDITDVGFLAEPVDDSRTMSASLAAGVRRALMAKPQAIMVALGDMPFVSSGHIRKLVDAFDGRSVASWDGAAIRPPAVFGPDMFAKLQNLSGDKGAKSLLDGARRVPANPLELGDIDTPEDIEKLSQQQLRQG